MESLGEALPKEQERVREILGLYKEIGPAGVMAPWGGIIAAGECANEQTFMVAVRARMPH